MAAKVENIKFFTDNASGNLKAYVSIVYHGLVLKGLKLFCKKEDEKSFFVTMPSQQKKDSDKYNDTFYFLDKKLKEEVEKKIINEWNKTHK